MITKGKTKLEKELLKKYNFITKVVYDGALQGYRLYVKGIYNLPSFRTYHWLNKRGIEK